MPQEPWDGFNTRGAWSSRGPPSEAPHGGAARGGGAPLDVTMAPSTWHWAPGARKDEAGVCLENTTGALPSPLAICLSGGQ